MSDSLEQTDSEQDSLLFGGSRGSSSWWWLAILQFEFALTDLLMTKVLILNRDEVEDVEDATDGEGEGALDCLDRLLAAEDLFLLEVLVLP